MKTIASSWAQYMGGQFWLWWPSYVTFFTDACGLEISADLKQRMDDYLDTLVGGWWWPHKDFVLICERPAAIRRDDAGRLHNADGMAIEWRDGWGFHSWHGTRVPARLIQAPEMYTADEIRGEQNSETVRALAEKLGWETFLAKLGAKVINSWRDPRTALTYELLDTDRFGEQQPRLLRMKSPKLIDDSQPDYIEEVDPGLATAMAARAWQQQKDNGSWPSVDECNALKLLPQIPSADKLQLVRIQFPDFDQEF